MGLVGVVLVLDRGDAALGPVRCRIGCALLGDDRDAQVPGDTQGIEQARDPAAEDEDVETLRLLHGHSCGGIGPPRVP